jgi:spore germination protein KA
MFRKNKEKMTNEAGRNNTRQQLTKSLSENVNTFKSIFQNDNTIIFRDIENTHYSNFHACLIYIDGMINIDITNKNIIYPLMTADLKSQDTDSNILDKLKNKVVSTSQILKTGIIDDLLLALFNGDAVLLVDNFDEALLISCKGWQTRALEESSLEKVLRGPKEAFTEPIMVNLTLIRRRLKTPDLKFKFKEIGVRSRTKVCICYIETLASEEILEELENRLDKIIIDGIISTGYIEELIKDCPLSPFKTIGNTERPDVVAAKLLEGRIAVIVDGTPSTLTLPFVFIEYFQSAEDYYDNYYFSSINRILRTLGELFTTSIPAIYIALITFHQEMIPTPLLLSIASARQGVPFPSIIEAIVLLFVFEIIREAGIRMPSPMGQSVSIVGALILGEAAIEARLFSAPMVIVVAATGITGILNIKLKGASIIIRLILLLLSAVLGLYGYIFGVLGVLIYLFSMRSFGVPYMLEYGSINPVDLKDTFIRAPWWYMNFRPKHISAKNIIRQSTPKPKGK